MTKEPKSEFCPQHDNFMEEVSDLMKTKVSSTAMYWILGIVFTLIFGCYGYAFSISHDQQSLATNDDIRRVEARLDKILDHLEKR